MVGRRGVANVYVTGTNGRGLYVRVELSDQEAVKTDGAFAERIRSWPQLSSLAEDELALRGYTTLPEVVPLQRIADLRRSFEERLKEEGSLASIEPGSLRLSNCVNKGKDFLQAIFFAPMLSAAATVIGRPFKLHGYNARNPLLGGGVQALHRDIDTGPQLEGRRTNGSRDLINALWVLDDFTESNGPTRVIPGSHLHSRDIHDEMADPTHRHPEEELLIAPAGTIVIINGALWHSGTENVSGEPRRALHISFVERHFPQQVAQRTHIGEGALLGLSGGERYLLDVETVARDRKRSRGSQDLTQSKLPVAHVGR
jgi:hypothetical protein